MFKSMYYKCEWPCKQHKLVKPSPPAINMTDVDCLLLLTVLSRPGIYIPFCYHLLLARIIAKICFVLFKVDSIMFTLQLIKVINSLEIPALFLLMFWHISDDTSFIRFTKEYKKIIPWHIIFKFLHCLSTMIQIIL